jgi:uncharacterized protein DUF5701
MSTLAPTLPALREQAERLIELGLHMRAGLSAAALLSAAEQPVTEPALLAIRPDLAPASALAPLLRWRDKAGFIVTDMTDVDEFTPIETVALPGSPVYLVHGLDRGDAMANWSPDEALPAIVGANRTPLVLTEGMHWLLQRPETLERGNCFMTIGSRRRTASGTLDARTPALWISNGTGRDGAANRDAPKVGWCWAGNRHTWLGFASAGDRGPLPG